MRFVSGVCVEALSYKADFNALRQRGKRFRGRLIRGTFLKLPGGLRIDSHHINLKRAFILSKRYAKKATVRNRVRRRLQHALGEALKEKALQVHAYFLAVPSLDVQTCDFKALVQEMKGHLENLSKDDRGQS